MLDATAPRSARCRRSWFAAGVLAVLASTNPVTASDDGVAVGGAQVACVSELAWFHTRTRDRTRMRERECEVLAEAVARLERALELSIKHRTLSPVDRSRAWNRPPTRSTRHPHESSRGVLRR